MKRKAYERERMKHSTNAKNKKKCKFDKCKIGKKGEGKGKIEMD